MTQGPRDEPSAERSVGASRASGLGAIPDREALERALAGAITPEGLGADAARRLLDDEVLAGCLRVDHPTFLSFVPAAPDPLSVSADQAVSAAGIYAGDWIEAAGALHAERQVIRLLAQLAGLPAEADGTFVSGGSAGTLSALAAARQRWRASDADRATRRGLVLASDEVHSSVAAATRILDVDLRLVATDADGRLTAEGLEGVAASLDRGDLDRVIAVVATAGTTSTGVVDELGGVAAVARDRGWWLHVDGAYGLACLLSERLRPVVAGVEHADSFVVDPHKWLFAPYDAGALVYRDPRWARAAHGQQAPYLDVLRRDGSDGDDRIDPSELAFQLSRRARGLPLWFGLVARGTERYALAVEHGVALADWTAAAIREAAHLELVAEPELSVVLFRRRGWDAARCTAWSTDLFARGLGYVTPTRWRGGPAFRFCFVNPATTTEHVARILATLR